MAGHYNCNYDTTINKAAKLALFKVDRVYRLWVGNTESFYFDIFIGCEFSIPCLDNTCNTESFYFAKTIETILPLCFITQNYSSTKPLFSNNLKLCINNRYFVTNHIMSPDIYTITWLFNHQEGPMCALVCVVFLYYNSIYVTNFVCNKF